MEKIIEIGGGPVQKMTTKDYYKYKSAILVANEEKDKEALRAIQKQLIAQYGLNDEDVKALLKLFKFTV